MGQVEHVSAPVDATDAKLKYTFVFLDSYLGSTTTIDWIKDSMSMSSAMCFGFQSRADLCHDYRFWLNWGDRSNRYVQLADK